MSGPARRVGAIELWGIGAPTPERGEECAREALAMTVDDLREARAALDRVTALAVQWVSQPADYDDDTEQQIADGKAIIAALAKPFCPVCSEPTDTLPHPPCTDGGDDERQPY